MAKVYTSSEEFLKDNEKVNLPYTQDLGILKTPLELGGITVNNRLVCQAMEGCDGNSDGTPAELTVRRYDRFAEGSAGLIWFEATAVMEEGRANPRQLWITEQNLDAFKKEVERIKEKGFKANGFEPKIIMQATHSGRYSKPHGTPAPLIAYNNPIFEKDSPISSDRIVTDEYLDRVGEKLALGAKLAQKAGFDGVDIKCCHRYLNSELLSAYTRKGRYGGSFENRTRLLREAVQGARELCDSGFEISTRLNVYDGFEYPYGFGVKEGEGITPDFSEAIALITELGRLGVNFVNVTMGNPYFNPHVNRPYAKGGYIPPEEALTGVARMLCGTEQIKKAVPQVKLICSALSYLGTEAAAVAAGFIERGGFDLAGFGRTIFAYPDFAKDIIEKGAMEKNKICICCSKCTEIMRAGGTPGCVIRDPLYTKIYKEMF
jgi:2,4-dienoyl-CoA reductase-like NADH-dependent reductase (Old Yellow Enzyme family)